MSSPSSSFSYFFWRFDKFLVLFIYLLSIIHDGYGYDNGEAEIESGNNNHNKDSSSILFARQGEQCTSMKPCAQNEGLSCGRINARKNENSDNELLNSQPLLMSSAAQLPTYCLKLMKEGDKCNEALAPAFATHCEDGLVCHRQGRGSNSNTESDKDYGGRTNDSGDMSMVGMSGVCKKIVYAEQGSLCDGDEMSIANYDYDELKRGSASSSSESVAALIVCKDGLVCGIIPGYSVFCTH